MRPHGRVRRSGAVVVIAWILALDRPRNVTAGRWAGCSRKRYGITLVTLPLRGWPHRRVRGSAAARRAPDQRARTAGRRRSTGAARRRHAQGAGHPRPPRVERRPYARDELAALLWPEADDESARGALRRTLSVLRSALGDRGSSSTDRSSSSTRRRRRRPRRLERAASSSDPRVLAAAADLAARPVPRGLLAPRQRRFDDWRATRAVAAERSVASCSTGSPTSAERGR